MTVIENQTQQTDKLTNSLYRIGVCIFPFLVLTVLFIRWLEPEQIGNFPCLLLRFTGLYCPGCGGTRALFALCNGRIVEALWYHPLVPYSFGLYLVFMITHTLERRKVPHIKGILYRNVYLYIAVGIIAFQFVLKNVLRIFFKIYM